MAAPGARWDAVAGVGMGMGAGALGTMPWAAIAPARTSPDFGPFGHPDGLALWGYARNAPGMMVDPRGEIIPAVILERIAVGAVVGAAASIGTHIVQNVASGSDLRSAVNSIDYRFVEIDAAIGAAALPGLASVASLLKTMLTISPAQYTAMSLTTKTNLFGKAYVGAVSTGLLWHIEKTYDCWASQPRLRFPIFRSEFGVTP